MESWACRVQMIRARQNRGLSTNIRGHKGRMTPYEVRQWEYPFWLCTRILECAAR